MVKKKTNLSHILAPGEEATPKPCKWIGRVGPSRLQQIEYRAIEELGKGHNREESSWRMKKIHPVNVGKKNLKIAEAGLCLVGTGGEAKGS